MGGHRQRRHLSVTILRKGKMLGSATDLLGTPGEKQTRNKSGVEPSGELTGPHFYFQKSAEKAHFY